MKTNYKNPWVDIFVPYLEQMINDDSFPKILQTPPPQLTLEQTISHFNKSEYLHTVCTVIDGLYYQQNVSSNEDVKNEIKKSLSYELSTLAIKKANFTQMKNANGDVEIRGKMVIMSVEEFAKLLQGEN